MHLLVGTQERFSMVATVDTDGCQKMVWGWDLQKLQGIHTSNIVEPHDLPECVHWLSIHGSQIWKAVEDEHP